MDFATVGKLGTYVKQKNLMFAAKHKIRTGQTLTNSSGNLISANLLSTFDKLRQASKASTNQAKQQKLARIKQKLKSGQKLTDEELGFLRVNDPKTYKKAKHADEAREELKSELKKAKSKSEAREAMTRAMVKASADAMAELSALGSGGGSMAGGGSVTGSANVAQGEVSIGGEISSGDANTSTDAGNQSFVEGNQSAQNSAETATADHDAEKNSAQKNSDADELTPEDIMEKYIWTIRALQDEWAHFTNSDEYKNLPEHRTDEIVAEKKIYRQVDASDRILLTAAAVYRKHMFALQ